MRLTLELCSLMLAMIATAIEDEFSPTFARPPMTLCPPVRNSLLEYSIQIHP